MKIIQLVTGVSGEDGNTDHQMYGLGDNGTLYIWRDARKPYAVSQQHRTRVADENIKSCTGPVYFYDGCTAGWELIGNSDALTRTVVHPLDPTRHERS